MGFKNSKGVTDELREGISGVLSIETVKEEGRINWLDKHRYFMLALYLVWYTTRIWLEPGTWSVVINIIGSCCVILSVAGVVSGLKGINSRFKKEDGDAKKREYKYGIRDTIVMTATYFWLIWLVLIDIVRAKEGMELEVRNVFWVYLVLMIWEYVYKLGSWKINDKIAKEKRDRFIRSKIRVKMYGAEEVITYIGAKVNVDVGGSLEIENACGYITTADELTITDIFEKKSRIILNGDDVEYIKLDGEKSYRYLREKNEWMEISVY